jgi:hypothetical protein
VSFRSFVRLLSQVQVNMNDDDDIPVLRDAVSRNPATGLDQKQIDELCDSLNAEAWELIDKLIAESLQEAEETLRLKISDRLSSELPALIEKTVREKLGNNTNQV